MRHYLKIYRQLLISNWNTFLAYPGDSVNSIMSSLGWGIFSVLAATLMTSSVTSIAGWSRGEVILMTATYGIIVGTFHVIFSPNFSNFGRIIHTGNLDTYLLLPVRANILLSLVKIKYPTLIRVLASWVLAAVLISTFGMQTSIVRLGAFLMLGFASFLLLYGVNLSIATLLLFFPDSENLMELASTATGTARYPADVLRNVPRIFILVFLPFLLVISIPTKVLVGRAVPSEVVLFASIAIGLFTFSLWFWSFAMRWYTGASR